MRIQLHRIQFLVVQITRHHPHSILIETYRLQVQIETDSGILGTKNDPFLSGIPHINVFQQSIRLINAPKAKHILRVNSNSPTVIPW